ncbi:hypothetical protein [Bradyrhizobium cytisi]|uniref:Uncharacterized protein n=1 Tax=Bradyrhizobium cytisi TaxID=515489 RepID=A0A5S4WZD9_9BRAD|nr:hypothetical protein [Bradyrhizobium cytisi]TYL87385.1 hypothetical protein FXB38_04475 [Bradyrhizobium cytisi]
MAAFHTIVDIQWRDVSFGQRLALSMISTTLAPISNDARMTVLMSLLGNQVMDMTEGEGQIDAVLDVLRTHLKLAMHSRQLTQ